MVCSFLTVLKPLTVSTNSSSSMNCRSRPGSDLGSVQTRLSERGWAYISGVSHHPAVVARRVWVPHVLVPRRLHVHQLADAASQGADAEDPQLPLRRGDVPHRLAFGLRHVLARARGHGHGHGRHARTRRSFFLAGAGFTSVLMLKPLRVTLPARPAASGRVSNWGGGS